MKVRLYAGDVHLNRKDEKMYVEIHFFFIFEETER